jgi:hypothetical protein
MLKLNRTTSTPESTPSAVLSRYWLDAALIALLVLLVVTYARSFVLNAPPLEDAAMLMRYAEHLAQGHGIVWNIGEKPVDGATDFLLVVAVAAVMKLGFGVERAVVLIGLGSHLLTTLLIYAGVRWLCRASAFAALASAAFFAVGPGVEYVSLGFGTPFFALLAATTWCCAIISSNASEAQADKRWFALFSLSALLMGLTRPEGVLLAGLMLLAVVYWRGLRQSKSLIVIFCLTFAALGGAYFLWRWNYFGYPLPNPFYKKGGGRLYWLSLGASINNGLTLTLPFLMAFVLGFRSPKTARASIFALIPLLGFMFVWVLLSNEMNWLMRFQYALAPLALITWPLALQGIGSELALTARQVWVGRVALVAGLCLSLYFQQFAYRGVVDNERYDNTYRISKMLSQYRDKGYTLATTEAGLVSLYSEWRSIDTYGLNDQWIAHNNGISLAYLEQHKPHVLVLHTDFAPQEMPPINEMTGDWNGLRNWRNMLGVLFQYAQANDYELAAAYGYSWQSVYYYYVRKDFADSAAITAQIRALRDELQEIKTRDFAVLKREP